MSLWIVARFLGAESYGIWVMLLAFATSTASLGSTGYSVYLIQSGTRSNVAHGKVGNVFWNCLAIGLVTSILIFPLLWWFSANRQDLGENYIQWLAFPIVLSMVLSYYGRFGLQAAERFKDYSVNFAFDRLIFTVAIIVLLPFGLISIGWLVAAQCLALLLGSTQAYLRLRKSLDYKLKDFKGGDFLRVNTPNFAAVYSNFFLSSSFLILAISRFGSTGALVGQLGLAFRCLGFIQQPLRWITPTVFPALTRARENGGKEAVVKVVERKIIPIGWFCTILYLLVQPMLFYLPVLETIFNESYRGTEVWLAIVLAAIGGEILNSFLVKALWALDRNNSILISSALGAFPVVVAFLTTASPTMLVYAYAIGVWGRAGAQLYLAGSKNLGTWILLTLSASVSLTFPATLILGFTGSILGWVNVVLCLALGLISIVFYRQLLDAVDFRKVRRLEPSEVTN